jgi:carbonyl reductase 1
MDVAVVTGANRGIGFEVCRQLARHRKHVILTARDEDAAAAACEALKGDGLSVEPFLLDVTRPDTLLGLAAHITAEHGGLDILVNNAGITMSGFDREVARRTIDVNFYGPLRVTEQLLPRMRAGGRVVMVSSGLADRGGMPRSLAARFTDPSLTRDELCGLMEKFVADVAAGRHTREGWPTSAYGVSKTGLNALTMVFARALEGDPRRILVNAVCPGWVRTAMGGPGAPRSVEHGAETLVWAALLPPRGPTGGFFRDMVPAEW